MNWEPDISWRARLLVERISSLSSSADEPTRTALAELRDFLLGHIQASRRLEADPLEMAVQDAIDVVASWETQYERAGYPTEVIVEGSAILSHFGDSDADRAAVARLAGLVSSMERRLGCTAQCLFVADERQRRRKVSSDVWVWRAPRSYLNSRLAAHVQKLKRGRVLIVGADFDTKTQMQQVVMDSPTTGLAFDSELEDFIGYLAALNWLETLEGKAIPVPPNDPEEAVARTIWFHRFELGGEKFIGDKFAGGFIPQYAYVPIELPQERVRRRAWRTPLSPAGYRVYSKAQGGL